MSEAKTYPIRPEIAAHAHITEKTYNSLYQRSINDTEAFWAEQAQQFLSWDKPFEKVLDYDYLKGYTRWFEGGRLNVSTNCLDRHLETRGDQVAIIWESDNPANHKTLTYRQLHEQVCKFANVLKAQGVKKGDRICIYLPMILESAVAILACTRVGAVHSIVFGGFS
ncbi:MAG: acetyl-coenzyme A synthetase N-terminal domain-containing protein, partial [Methylicorpusculum sp.]|nr:acetyl-coenzyme A synthetase N-terminal domain-containing protein [Methylicorpusculum sp.]